MGLMSYLIAGPARAVGGIEATCRYLIGKVPFVPSGTEKVIRTCAGTIVNSKLEMMRPELAGEEIYKFFKPTFDWLYQGCADDTFCQRAMARTFIPLITTTGVLVLKTSKSVADLLSNVTILSSLSKAADEILRWEIRDGYKEGTIMQTLFSEATITAATGVAILSPVLYHRMPRKHKSIKLCTLAYLMAAYAGCVAVGELISLHERAKMENACFSS